MSDKLEEFLSILLWGFDRLLNPRMGRVGESYEAWAHRNGYSQQLRTLRSRGHVAGPGSTEDERLSRVGALSEAGRLRALGGRDPEARWKRPWDGWWRMLVYDVPEWQNATRVHLRRNLRGHCFGLMQESGWIHPDPAPEEIQQLQASGPDVRRVFILAGRPEPDLPDAAIVKAAWHFDGINGRYREYLDLLEWPPVVYESELSMNHEVRLREWLAKERELWDAVISIDPLLPSELLPEDYLGRKAWALRCEVLPPLIHGLLGMSSDHP